MEARGSIPPGLPRPDPTVSYWQNPPNEIANLRTTEELLSDADIVIIGSGISGSTIAYNILSAEPLKRVVLLEARQAASGASGRNGGHTKGASYRTFLNNVNAVGADDAIKIARLEYTCMITVHDFIRQKGIDCDSRRCDTVDIFYDQSQLEKGQRSVDLMRELMGSKDPAAQYTFHTPEETASKFLIPDSLGSVTYEAGSLNAYKLTIGILKLALSSGLNLKTNTPATYIKRPAPRSNWHIETPRGAITTPTLILATNGYTAHLYPKLLGMIVPFRGIVTAQRPGLSLPQTGLDTTFSFIYAKGYEYMISRPAGSKNEGDIVIGGGLTKTAHDGLGEYGNTDDTVLNHEIVHYLTGSAAGFYSNNWGEDHSDGRIRHVHSGVMGYSGDGYPLVGPMPGEDGLYIDASFQGHGMVLCFLCAKAASQMILGTEQEENLDEWFPKSYRMRSDRFSHKFKGRMDRFKDANPAVEVGTNGVNGVKH